MLTVCFGAVLRAPVSKRRAQFGQRRETLPADVREVICEQKQVR
jgi:hypothetical protein